MCQLDVGGWRKEKGTYLVLEGTVNRHSIITIGTGDDRLILVGWSCCDRVNNTAALGNFHVGKFFVLCVLHVSA